MTNISKFDVECKRPYGDYLVEISKIDDLLIKEIEILNPDVILFFTGPNLDTRIKNIFEGIKYENLEGFNYRVASKLIHEALPEHTYRTHHPKSLRFRKIENAILQLLKEKITIT